MPRCKAPHRRRTIGSHNDFIFKETPMTVRGIRGATTADANTRESILGATRELLAAIVKANDLNVADLASIYFTVTPDLDAAFPARAARDLGWNDTALLDAQAPRVVGDLPRCIRVLIHWNTDRAASDIAHVYLRDAKTLRPDRLASRKPVRSSEETR
jgi:chorismate mutase